MYFFLLAPTTGFKLQHTSQVKKVVPCILLNTTRSLLYLQTYFSMKGTMEETQLLSERAVLMD